MSQTTTPSFTRTYTWSIAKSVVTTLFDPGGTATYKVTVTQTGCTDSGWQVNGNITVSNPNDFESIALTNVTDAVNNGGVTIDLTVICKMCDNLSTMTATCGGTLQNVSSAFGGATTLTVSQMLTYAASQANSGGTTWYGQIKTTANLTRISRY